MKKAKIVLNQNEIEVFIKPRKNEDFMFNSSITTKNEYHLIYLYNKIKELEYLGYEITFENTDNVEIPEIN